MAHRRPAPRQGLRTLMAAAPARTRATILGVAAGVVAAPLLAPSLGVGAALATGALAGVAWPALFRRSTPGESLMSGAALGLPLWVLVAVVLVPLLGGAAPRWSAAELRALLPALVGFVLFGAGLGALAHGLAAAADRALGPAPAAAPAPLPPPRRVVILGGGFAGFTCARELERLLEADRSVQVTLVSDTNALLFTPMLAEVAGSSLEPTHISTPLRSSLHRTAVVRGEIARVDLAARAVVLRASDGGPGRTLPYDQLVVAVGAVTNYFGSAAIEATAIGFKSLGEATRIRNRVIDALERAEREPDPAARAAHLTFVVAGGGFAGVELAGALNDFARGALADYPGLSPQDVRVLLVHAGDRILPELSASLGAYAEARLRERGVEFALGARVADARPGAVVLEPPATVDAATLVWTAGARPSPLLGLLPVERDRRGAIQVDANLAVPGWPGVWAGGDCAAITDAVTGRPCPPTAQFALREGRQLARNVLAALRGEEPRPFRFASLGALCVIGHQTACAELRIPFTRGRSIRFSGLLAWLLWRAIYLSKLPGLDRKVRVLSDWTLELFFPRDIVRIADERSAPVTR
ncbi:NAD(P)/FAD-dependent oxidoreductase [Anaeromyxobacter oryzae]|uniref:NAD(P)/FAD-dependent oxidoreductase n=1 Tax=Anaeromyxobacter oryzae TaxID=2918170 RepID=UPI0020C1139D|nr:NAD(P)/FAD-dependent oxidoreductase [Anaeromyxobacter oryzae]